METKNCIMCSIKPLYFQTTSNAKDGIFHFPWGGLNKIDIMVFGVGLKVLWNLAYYYSMRSRVKVLNVNSSKKYCYKKNYLYRLGQKILHLECK